MGLHVSQGRTFRLTEISVYSSVKNNLQVCSSIPSNNKESILMIPVPIYLLDDIAVHY